jgi:NAD(P)H-binding
VREASRRHASESNTTIVGDVLDATVLRAGLESGAHAVVSCLGIRRRHPRNPWSHVDGVRSLVTPMASTVQRLATGTQVRRFIAVSSAGVADSASVTHPLLRWVFANSNVRIAFDDLAGMERVLAGGSLEWMAVRPTRLVDGPPTGRVRECGRFGLRSCITRGDVAAWMLDAAELGVLPRNRTPMITTWAADRA